MSWKLSLLALQGLALQALGAGRDPNPPFSFNPNLLPLQENAGTEGLFPMADCVGFKLEEATINDMRQALEDGQLTSVELVACYLTRTYQTQEYINSVLQVNPDVFAIAAQRDAERKKGNVRGPLHGIPFTVKDNIGSKDSMETTAGSWTILGNIVPRDAHVVKKLRDSGAVLFAKATLSEWADMRSNDYSEGYSARGGQVRSSYNFTVNPGGSSSGSAVGVAANAIAFSLGTETDGSVINPANRNALVGLKPTVGLTSRAGVIPESEHQDSVGVLARTVTDATLVLDAIYGVDKRDNYTLAQKGKTPPCGYAPYLTNKTALKDAVFGLPWESFWVYADDDMKSQLLDLLDLIKSAGATIINGTEITNYEILVSPDGWNWDYGTTRGYPNESEYTYIKVDFYRNVETYLSEVNNTNVKNLADIVQYNEDFDGSEGGFPYADGKGIPAFASGQDGFLASLATNGERNETYWQALNFCQTSCRQGIDDALSYNGKQLSGLLVPPQVAQAPQIAAQAGYPVITIPGGYSADSGMPFGLGIMQTAWAEDKLVKWASAIEDLQRSTDAPSKRRLPKWLGYLERNIPVPF
ncbi:amidase signature domain-containing protein [Emericellopsis atlantica]|uniref:Amidase signature domain-containing protein n=1 Tax=Emericellopsis atlantica TaxID=2614577 RepID=A0A9P7ZCY1_9HYPO|nr:amidase signature domain-containing protein [Emericellopsis atlantica]KAG9249759.1 amidase signature domain-containing protein [Emericellopsis atlantica]